MLPGWFPAEESCGHGCYMVVQIASPDMTRVSDAGGIKTERFKRKLLQSKVRRR